MSPSPPMQSKTDCSPKTKTDCSPKTVALAPSSLLAAMRRCLAHHAVQDRSLGPDACIHAFALTPYRCAMSRYFAIASRPLPSPSPPMQSKTDCSPKSKTDCSPKTVALAPMIQPQDRCLRSPKTKTDCSPKTVALAPSSLLPTAVPRPRPTAVPRP